MFFTFTVLHLNMACDIHPCDKVLHCPVSRCQSQQFRWSRDVRISIFSRTTLSTRVIQIYLAIYTNISRFMKIGRGV